ncbi:MAG: Rpp14/Pop5 family protein [Methanoregulaceae archaeon]|nr:Rpp14/Pop5 family protein [Methanoregulaceae archaeon]
MKARPPTMREKKRYILARINPPVPDPDPKELYFAVLESVTSLFGDAQTARMMPVVISCGKGYALIRCTRGYEEQTRIALMTLTSVAERKIALHPVATSGTLLALKRRIARMPPLGWELVSPLQFKGSEYTARRYPGQKVDLLEKGIKSQELLFLTQDDLEEL